MNFVDDLAPSPPPLDAFYRPMLKVLEAVHCLHRAGYQRLRIVPGLSGTGLAWRCGITYADNILPDHGALPRSFAWETMPQYSSASEYDFFDKHWGLSADHCNPKSIAKRFLTFFPDVAARGRGLDFEYAGWLTIVIGYALQGCFPLAFGDYIEPVFAADGTMCLATQTNILMPMPPLVKPQ